VTAASVADERPWPQVGPAVVEPGISPPLAERVYVAAGLLSRLRGLIGHPPLEAGEALWIRPCTGVHTFFMKTPIDVVFLDAEGTVVAVERLRPWRLGRVYLRAASAIELPAGAAQVAVGDRVRVG
jgi:uncharacterized membrane protein (UPF0127 family)